MTTKTIEVIEHDASEVEEIVLETKPVRLAVDNTRDREWLARDIFSTPYATVLPE